MTLFLSKQGAMVAGASAKAARKCDSFKIDWAVMVAADRSMDRGYKVTLFDATNRHIGAL